MALPASVSLVSAANCSLNVPLSVLQMFLVAADTPEIPQINRIVANLQCIEIGALAFAQTVGVFFLTSFLDFIVLTTEELMSSSSVQEQTLYFGKTRPASQAAAIGHVFGTTQTEIRIASGPTNPCWPAGMVQNQTQGVGNTTANPCYFNYTVLVSNILAVFEAPVADVFSQPIAGYLAFINLTWSLTQLAPLNSGHGLNPPFAQVFSYVQFGFVQQWFRQGAQASGDVFAACFSIFSWVIDLQSLANAFAAIGPIGLGIISPFSAGFIIVDLFGIIWEGFVQYFIVAQIYYPPSSGNPYQQFTTYCTAPNTSATQLLTDMYNATASIAVVRCAPPPPFFPYAPPPPRYLAATRPSAPSRS